jgi:hypothetical protein
MSESKEREEFEAWFGRALDFTKNKTWADAWEYTHPHVESIWYGWRARAACAAAASPSQPMTPEHAQQAFGHVGVAATKEGKA